MEIRLFTRAELWSLLEAENNIFTRYVMISDTEIQSKVPGITIKELPMMWLLDNSEVRTELRFTF